jgi:predicted HD phosphohydrolase
MPSDPASTADHVLAVLRDAANADYIGEPVSQLDHALQAAAAARRADASADEVLAALLHDIGHLVAPADHPTRSDVGVIDHERVGQAYLRDLGFGDAVVALVGLHVDAKRFLVARNAAYREALSRASERSIELQGGPMTSDECSASERSPLRDAALRVRSWDEAAKVPGARVDGLEAYRELIVIHLDAAVG